MNTKWDLKAFFKDEKALKTAKIEVERLQEKLLSYQGKLIDNLEEFLSEYEKLELLLTDIYSYLAMSFHLDMKDNNLLKGYGEAELLATSVNEKLAWFTPELLKSTKEEALNQLSDIKKEKFSHYLDAVYAQKTHILSEEVEEVLVSLGKAANDAVNAYSALTISDRNPVEVEVDGKKLKLSSGNYTKLLTDEKNQENRKKIFESYYSYYKDHGNTLASLYNTVLSIESKTAKLRGYNSSLEAKLADLQIPMEVYESLLANTKKQSFIMKDFIKYRVDKLGLDDFHNYDRFQKIFTTDKEYSYEEGYDLVIKAAGEASPEYKKLFEEVLQAGYIDVFPKEGKMTGAYSWGSYNTHPYILHNYDKSLNSVYTLMHEAGHSLHSVLANTNQTFFNASYPIYLAEIASTFSECLLTDYLLKTEKDESVKKTLLEESILGVMATFFRQTLFADFEYQTHKLVDAGEVLTVEVLNEIMKKLYKEYYDMDLDREEYKKYVWGYIPHLINTPFYVYQYASCITASIAIYDTYLEDKEKGLDTLFAILKAGGSDYPDKILKESGIDLTKDETYARVGSYLEKKLRELKA